jgi:hypothetical protein
MSTAPCLFPLVSILFDLARESLRFLLLGTRAGSALTLSKSIGVEKIPWQGVLISVQPRIRLGRSFDLRSHTYLGYALRVCVNIAGSDGFHYQ